MLSIVATPIGNLGDITQRALQTLEAADCICAEDTRVTGKLLSAFGIENRLERCDENTILQRTPYLVERMQAGEHIAFCSDAGMPGVSDPGLALVDVCHDAGIRVEVVPGASAVPTALAAAGFSGTAFYFGGFLPRKQREQRALLASLAALDATLVFYESPKRVVASLESIAETLLDRRVALCRELTKLHEEIVRMPASELAAHLSARTSIKGEIALVIESPTQLDSTFDPDDPALAERIRNELAAGARKSALAKELAAEFGVSKNELYELIHSL